MLLTIEEDQAISEKIWKKGVLVSLSYIFCLRRSLCPFLKREVQDTQRSGELWSVMKTKPELQEVSKHV